MTAFNTARAETESPRSEAKGIKAGRDEGKNKSCLCEVGRGERDEGRDIDRRDNVEGCIYWSVRGRG